MGGEIAGSGRRDADVAELQVGPPVLGVQLRQAAGGVRHRLEPDGVDDVPGERVATLLVGGEVVRTQRQVSLWVVRWVHGVRRHGLPLLQDNHGHVRDRCPLLEVIGTVQLHQVVDALLHGIHRDVLAEGG